MSEIMYVFQNNFWPGFGSDDDKSYKFLIDILEKVFNKPIRDTKNPYNADILLESIGFTGQTSKLNIKEWKYTILFSGEPILCPQYEMYDCILWGRESSGKIVCFPLFILDTISSKSIEQITKYTPSPNEKISLPPNKKLIAIISNGSSTQRNSILDKLEKYFPIDYAGSFRNNRRRIEAGFHSKEFWNEIAQYRAILCFENTKDTDYVTEKIIHGFASKNIPVYWGAKNISNYFNANRFILIEDENSIDSAIQEIQRIMDDDNYYYEKLYAPIFPNGMTGDQIIEKEINRIVEEMRNCLVYKNIYTPTAPII